MKLTKNYICSTEDPLHIDIDMDSIEDPPLPEPPKVEDEKDELSRSIDIDMHGLEDPPLSDSSEPEDKHDEINKTYEDSENNSIRSEEESE